MTLATTKFETGRTYQMTYVTDADLRPEFKCVKRTSKTATFAGKHETFTKRIKELDGIEYIVYASYSMAPVISAKRLVS